MSVFSHKADHGVRKYVQVPANNVFQHGTLATGLTAHDDDLGQVNGVIDTDGRENILELVDESV